MKKTKLLNGENIYCISKIEAQMLYEHVSGYFDNFITVNDSDTIVDIGANIGVYGAEMKKRYPNTIIYAFEPIKHIFKVLKKNSESNEDFNVFNYGVSDSNGSTTFTYYPNSPAMSSSNPDLWKSNGELIPALKGNIEHAPKNWWWAKFIPTLMYPYIVNKLRSSAKKVNCNLKTLSSIITENSISNIDLLKIDCEGSELNVLNGIDRGDWNKIKQLIIEVHDTNNRLDYIDKMLVNKGFKTKVIKEPSLEKTKLFNIFAIRV